MKLDQLRDFVAIVEHGSLRGAARRLEAQQPSLTRSVRTLEKELGVSLFDRNATGMTLTPVGVLFHRRATAIVNEVRRARDEVLQTSGQDEGTVVAGISIMPHISMLPRALPIFKQRYPNITLQLIEGLFPDIEDDLRAGSLDFYLGAAPRLEPASGLVVKHLFDNTRAVVARKGHPLGHATTLAELSEMQWATTSVDYNAEDDLNQTFIAQGLPSPRVAFKARTALSMIVGIANTDMMAMVPSQWGEFPITGDSLMILPIRFSFPAPSIVLIHRQDLPLTPAAEHLCDVMLRFAPARPTDPA